ncbi:MAG: GNAT family N-acetyltransferase [Phycisphaeraceae bacterium]|nr:GNAT family N-acetyltransferase [Phycisphaeraceae bacterium]
MSTPVLETQRLHLRPFRLDDADDVFRYASNPNVARWVTWETHKSRADAVRFIDMVLSRPTDDHTWAIRVDSESRVVGAIDFACIKPGVADIHYVLAEEFWGQGLMTQAARVVLSWGLSTYPFLNLVETFAAADNIGSCRVLQKCGFAEVKHRYERWQKYTELVEVAVFSTTTLKKLKFSHLPVRRQLVGVPPQGDLRHGC